MYAPDILDLSPEQDWAFELPQAVVPERDVLRRQMQPDESVRLDLAHPLELNSDLYEKPVLARVHAGIDRFAVVAQRWDEDRKEAAGPFFLIHEDAVTDETSDMVPESVNFYNSTAFVGRAAQDRPFHLPETVSKRQFEARHDRRGGVHIRNFDPTNATVLEQAIRPDKGFGLKEGRLEKLGMAARRWMGNLALWLAEDGNDESGQRPVRNRLASIALSRIEHPIIPRPHSWHPGGTHIEALYTRHVSVEAGDGRRNADAPYGYLRGTDHPLIGRDSPTVKGGVYIHRHNGEATLVDHQSPELRAVSKEIIRRTSELHRGANRGWVSDRDILRAAQAYTVELLPYDTDKRIIDRQWGRHRGRDGVMALSELVRAGGGVCRHECLLLAYMMEELRSVGYLDGQIAVERSARKRSAHAWPVYNPAGNTDPDMVLVVEAALRRGFIGTKKEARRQGLHYDMPQGERW